MSTNIAGFIKKLLPDLSKSDLESDMTTSLESISTIVSSYSNLETVTKVAPLASSDNKELSKEFYKEIKPSKVKLGYKENIAQDTLTLFKNIQINGEYISKQLTDSLNSVVVSQTLTAVKSNLVRAVGHYYFITKFALDLVNLLYVNEVVNGKEIASKEFKVNAKQKEHVTKNLWLYARLLGMYGNDPDVFSVRFKDLSDVTLPKDQIDDVIASYDLDKVDLFNNLPSNFIGSPIYSIRLVFAQWEADRYKNLKDKKRLLELRYLHLKMLKEQNSQDASMEKEIEYLQKRVTDIDYKLSKIEGDLND